MESRRPRKTTARRPGQGQPKSTAAALKRSGQKKQPANRPFGLMGWGRTSAARPQGRPQSYSYAEPGYSRVFPYVPPEHPYGRGGKRIGEPGARNRVMAQVTPPGTSPATGGKRIGRVAGVTTGDVLRSAARKRTIAAAKTREKKRAASYKPKYRMGSRGGVRDDI
jgi:hypothetical protein